VESYFEVNQQQKNIEKKMPWVRVQDHEVVKTNAWPNEIKYLNKRQKQKREENIVKIDEEMICLKVPLEETGITNENVNYVDCSWVGLECYYVIQYVAWD